MDDLLPDLTLAFNETFQMLSISTVLAILAVYRSKAFDFCHRSSSVLAEPFYLSRHLGSGEYYPLGAICHFTGAVTAANAAFAGQYYWPDCSLRPAVGGRHRVLCTPVDSAPVKSIKGLLWRWPRR